MTLHNTPAFSGYSIDDQTSAHIFYAQTLGLTVTEDTQGLMLSFPNGQHVFLYKKSDHQPATFTVLNFPVDDIDKAIDELTSKGVTFERYDTLPAPQDERGVLRGRSVGRGPDIAWFRDPAGNILSLLQN